MASLNAKEKKKLAEKHAKILAELVKRPDNSTCADCGAQGPRWASWNLGVFLCIHCAGVHRRIGTHISKAKSISLDMWTTEQIEHFRRIGNRRANAFFNPRPERHPFNKNWTDRERERYIRDKYERRYFVDYGNGVPDPTTDNGEVPEDEEVPIPTLAKDEAYGLMRLREMGFKDVKANHAALVQADYDVDAAAKILRGNQQSSKSPSQITETDIRVKQLVRMGFEDKAQNIAALKQTKGDLIAAIELLVNNKVPEAPESSGAPAPTAIATTVSQGEALKKPKFSGSAAQDLLGMDLLSDSFGQSPAAVTNNSLGTGTGDPTPNKFDSILSKFSKINISKPVSTNTPPVTVNNQESDMFGDFGDFLSAAAPTSSTMTATKPMPSLVSATATVAATTGISASSWSNSSAAISPASAASGSSKTRDVFDKNFIMSLYSKSPATATKPNAMPTSSVARQPSSFAVADIDPWGSIDNVTPSTTTTTKSGTTSNNFLI